MIDEKPKLNELLDTIVGRLQDSMKDTQAAITCIQKYKEDPTGAQSCIIQYMQTGQVPEEAKPT